MDEKMESRTGPGGGEKELSRLLLLMVGSIVDRPEDIQIELLSAPKGPVFWVRVCAADMDKLEGHTVRALQVIVGSCGMKFGRRFEVQIAEE